MGIQAYTQPVDWRKIAHLFNKMSDMAIAKMHNVSTSAVCAARKRLGLSVPKTDLSFIDRYLDILSDTEIAEKFVIKRRAVYHRRYLVKHRH